MIDTSLLKVSYDPDKFGYYTVGDRRTYSKFEAYEWARGSGHQVSWNFNNEVFSQLNWKREPPVSLWSLYKLRAWQIRNSYDYVVHWYSGGSDSHNMLMAWLDAGCKLDEIATSWNYAATGDRQSFYNAEISNVVLPHVKQLQDQGHEFKFRLFDISQQSLDVFDHYGLDFEYQINSHFSPNGPSRMIMRDKIKDYKDMIAAGKRVCFVWGKDKPQLYLEDGRTCCRFVDRLDDSVGTMAQRNYHNGWYDELFYWTPDLPLLPLKAAHVVNNFLNTCMDPSFYEPRNAATAQTNGINKRLMMHLKDETLKTLLYPKWSNDTFCNGKSINLTFSLRDQWIWDSNLEHKTRFEEIAKSYFGTVDFVDPVNQKITPFFSPKYFLE